MRYQIEDGFVAIAYSEDGCAAWLATLIAILIPRHRIHSKSCSAIFAYPGAATSSFDSLLSISSVQRLPVPHTTFHYADSSSSARSYWTEDPHQSIFYYPNENEVFALYLAWVSTCTFAGGCWAGPICGMFNVLFISCFSVTGW